VGWFGGGFEEQFADNRSEGMDGRGALQLVLLDEVAEGLLGLVELS
jgi:hypothetical protein